MNAKTIIPLALAIVLGLFAAMAAKNMIDKNKQAPAQVTQYTQVVVARDNIPAGTELRPEDLTVGKMAGDIPADVVFGSPTEVAGRVLTCALLKGQPIMEPVLAPKGTGSGLQALLPKGMRAITIEVNEFSGVGGFLVPGCHVDVIATLNGPNNEQFDRTVVQNIKVMAVNSRINPPGPGAEPEPLRSVTLVATPKEAEALNLTAGAGRPRFVLRASGDDTVPFSDGVTLAELRGKAAHGDPFAETKPVELVKPTTMPIDQTAAWRATHQRTIQTIRGGVEGDVTIQISDRNTQWMTDVQNELKNALHE
jgi:pilus assembly protein CpaB